ncbi:MAG: hypothetical protein LBI53_06670 [Candidatus Peribacteria bacterium]|jgi:hypothetical protein|nr:hypothetical protein [Candidatus Peribacteria bacterium]
MAGKITVKWGIKIPLTNLEGRNGTKDCIKIQKIVFRNNGRWRDGGVEITTKLIVEKGIEKDISVLVIDIENGKLLLSAGVEGHFEKIIGYKAVSAKTFIETDGTCKKKK